MSFKLNYQDIFLITVVLKSFYNYVYIQFFKNFSNVVPKDFTPNAIFIQRTV